MKMNGKIDSLEEPYDLGSIMHYGKTFFSKNGKPTMVPRKPGVSFISESGKSVKHQMFHMLNTM